MAKVYERIEPRMARWIGEPVFFVATAPISGDGMVNVSPKGLRGTFGVLDDHTVAYVDMTASGIDTTAHRAYREAENEHSLDGLPGLAGLPDR